MTLHASLAQKAVREELAAMFERMADRAGAAFERHTSSLFPRGISCFIHLNGASVMLHLNGDSKAGAFLAHWYFSDRRGRLFRDGFDGHGYRARHKATSMADHAEDLCDRVEAMLSWVADGTAFTPEAA